MKAITVSALVFTASACLVMITNLHQYAIDRTTLKHFRLLGHRIEMLDDRVDALQRSLQQKRMIDDFTGDPVDDAPSVRRSPL